MFCLEHFSLKSIIKNIELKVNDPLTFKIALNGRARVERAQCSCGACSMLVWSVLNARVLIACFGNFSTS